MEAGPRPPTAPARVGVWDDGGLLHCGTVDWKWEKCFALGSTLEAVSVRLSDGLCAGQKGNKRGKYYSQILGVSH